MEKSSILPLEFIYLQWKKRNHRIIIFVNEAVVERAYSY